MFDMNVMLTTGETVESTGGVTNMLSDGLTVAREIVGFTWDVIVANPILSVIAVFGLIGGGIALFRKVKGTAK